LVSALLLGQLQVVELNKMFLTVTPVFWYAQLQLKLLVQTQELAVKLPEHFAGGVASWAGVAQHEHWRGFRPEGLETLAQEQLVAWISLK
jgi:hypothetical protein